MAGVAAGVKPFQNKVQTRMDNQGNKKCAVHYCRPHDRQYGRPRATLFNHIAASMSTPKINLFLNIFRNHDGEQEKS